MYVYEVRSDNCHSDGVLPYLDWVSSHLNPTRETGVAHNGRDE